MKKTLIFVMAAVCIFASLLVSCSNEAKLSDEPVRIRFGFDQSRGLNASQNIPKVNELFWYYKANRTAGTDSENINFGATTEWTKVNPDDSTGLNGIITLAQGRWDFELQGRKSANVSTAVYQGSISSVLILKDGNTVNTITVPVYPLTDGIGTVTISKDIIVKQNLSDGSGYKPTHYKYKATTAETYKPDQALSALVDTKLDLDAGTYDFVVMYKGTDTDSETEIIYASSPITVTVSANIETLITGSLEVITAPGQFDVVEVVGFKATASVDSSTAEEVSVVVPIAPSEEQGADTTVTFEAGALPSDAKKVVTEVKTVKEAQAANFSVSNGQTAVAAIDIKITDDSGNVKPVEGGKTVTVTTYILKGLTAGTVNVKYNGNGTDVTHPTDVQYDSETGRLSFKTTHFSEFYVVSDAVCYVVETNTAYQTLDAAFRAATGSRKTVILLKNITGQVTVPSGADVILDLNGKSISTTDATTIINNGTLVLKDSSGEGGVYSSYGNAVGVGDNSTTTIESGTYSGREGAVITGYATGATININGGTFSAADNAVIAGNGSNRIGEANIININGGTFNGGIITTGYVACGIYAPWKDVINVSGGTFTITGGAGIVARAGEVNVSGGTFNCTGDAKGKVGDSRIVVPCSALVFDSEAKYPAMTADSKITVTGGTFISEVAAITTVPEKDVGRIVIQGGSFIDLDSAINYASDNAVIKLANAGTYELPQMSDKKVSIIGTKDTVIDMENKVNKAESISFEGVTVKFGTNNYCGFQHTGKLTYRDCTIIGQQFLYANNVEFNNCVFAQDIVDYYNVWTYGAGNVLFKNCTFNCAGRSVLIYNEGSNGQTVEFENCKFNATAPVAGKAAIEIDSTYLNNDIYTVIIDQATANSVSGFSKGSVSNNSVWNNKLGNKATVIVAGNTVLSASSAS